MLVMVVLREQYGRKVVAMKRVCEAVVSQTVGENDGIQELEMLREACHSIVFSIKALLADLMFLLCGNYFCSCFVEVRSHSRNVIMKEPKKGNMY